MRFLTYAISEDGMIVSRLNGDRSEERRLAVPILQYEEIGKDGDFTGPLPYKLEKVGLFDMDQAWWRTARWTKKVPTAIKNLHREFWGMRPLRSDPSALIPSAAADGASGSYSGVAVRDDGTRAWTCSHLHRTRGAADRCARWFARRWQLGRCVCECHRNPRDLFHGCCSCN